MTSNKRGVIDNLSNLVTGLAAIAILLAVVFLIAGEARTQVIGTAPCTNQSAFYNQTSGQCCDLAGAAVDCSKVTGLSAALNGTNTTINATQEIPGWLPIVVITVIGGILLALVRLFRNSA